MSKRTSCLSTSKPKKTTIESMLLTPNPGNKMPEKFSVPEGFKLQGKAKVSEDGITYKKGNATISIKENANKSKKTIFILLNNKMRQAIVEYYKEGTQVKNKNTMFDGCANNMKESIIITLDPKKNQVTNTTIEYEDKKEKQRITKIFDKDGNEIKKQGGLAKIDKAEELPNGIKNPEKEVEIPGNKSKENAAGNGFKNQVGEQQDEQSSYSEETLKVAEEFYPKAKLDINKTSLRDNIVTGSGKGKVTTH